MAINPTLFGGTLGYGAGLGASELGQSVAPSVANSLSPVPIFNQAMDAIDTPRRLAVNAIGRLLGAPDANYTADILKRYMPESVASPLGFVGDIAIDPLNLALGGFGAVKGAISGGKAGAKMLARRSLASDLADASLVQLGAKQGMKSHIKQVNDLASKSGVSRQLALDLLEGPNKTYNPRLMQALGDQMTLPRQYNRVSPEFAQYLDELNAGYSLPGPRGGTAAVSYMPHERVKWMAGGKGGVMKLKGAKPQNNPIGDLLVDANPQMAGVYRNPGAFPAYAAADHVPTMGAANPFTGMSEVLDPRAMNDLMLPTGAGGYARVGDLPLDQAAVLAGSRSAELSSALRDLGDPSLMERALTIASNARLPTNSPLLRRLFGAA